MTSFDAPASGTANTVPGAAPPAYNPAETIATLANMLNAMVNLSGGSAPSPSPASASPAPAVVAAAPVAAAPVAPTVAPAVAPLSLRTQGPWLAGLLFIVVPTQHLQAVPEDPIADGEEHPVWYAITRGRHIGITLSNPFALAAIVGVSGGHMKKYKTQILALQAFNDSLTLGMVAVLP
ncbi:hypothetical protein R3P38DRAFT_2809194 [Favolaschia claudopus]|uniref:Uncharacterized protein n=1 Tax=Favolaschia claudopus TaxID=2862362 RepID=A0AAV9ZE34_9AGAR